MKLSALALSCIVLAMRAGSAMADTADIPSIDRNGGQYIHANGIWHTNNGHHEFNAGDGCREDSGVSNIRNLCVDLEEKESRAVGVWA
jgi:hypothetical protein